MSGTLLIALVAVLVIVGGWVLLRRRGAASSSRDDSDERLDTLAAWPPQATRVFTSQERTLYSTLIRALPDHLILAQVPLSRFIKVPKRHSYAEWLRRLGYQSVDFVVCDPGSHVIAAIELQPSGEANERARRRVKRIARTLKAAKIPLHIWSEDNLPTADTVREAILPKPAESAPAAAAPATATPATPAATPPVRAGMNVPTLSSAARPGTVHNPFEDSKRDSSFDEVIEAPPSTWFDEFDSGPGALPPNGKPPKR